MSKERTRVIASIACEADHQTRVSLARCHCHEDRTAVDNARTENHMVENVKQYCGNLGIEVVNLAQAPTQQKAMGCGCATMSRNDPPHLVAILDLLRKGESLAFNLVKAGDVVNEFTGSRSRLSNKEQQWVIDNAKIALKNMIAITEGTFK